MAADRPDDEDPARALGRALRELQRRSGCTLRSLETSVRISDSSLSRYFRGTTVPPWATVRDLCKALDGDPADLRLLWEAADRSQRGQTHGPGPREADTAKTGDGAPPGAPRRRLPVLGGRTAWALAGTVLGLVLGAGSAALVEWRSPTPGEGALPAAHGASASSDAPRIFVSRATGACLDDSLDMGTRSYACNGMSYQRWTVRPTTDGSVQLRNHATGECLDHHPDGLRTVPCGPSASQRWTVSAGDDEAVEVRNTTTRRCLDDSAGGVQVLACDRTPRQKWA
ncbi:helix-turn-helix domain-containing protein [Streptomyces sp. NPDC047971]|uniref:helix-turn-helix domain-containing protein n=1 Tax=Streptomyces sp. NPDC047971 TaxID=3154499 RepID=UPI0033F13BA1